MPIRSLGCAQKGPTRPILGEKVLPYPSCAFRVALMLVESLVKGGQKRAEALILSESAARSASRP